MMDSKELHDILAQNINHLIDDKDSKTPSMRYLSTCIDANESYIQKILSGSSFPSMDKLIAIANHFEVETWTLLFNHSKRGEEFEDTLMLLASCPHNMIPVIREYIRYLMSKEENE